MRKGKAMSEIKIPLDAVPQGRPRFYKGHAIDPPASRKFKADVAKFVATQKNVKLIDFPISVSIFIYRSIKKFNGKTGVTGKRYGDIDNLAKGILDALTGIIWKDDAQIVDLRVCKRLADEPFIDIIINPASSNTKYYYLEEEI